MWYSKSVPDLTGRKENEMKKKLFIRLCAAVLAVLTLLPCIVSCSEDAKPTATEGTKQPSRQIDDSIPEGLTFDGNTVNFIYHVDDNTPPLSVKSLTNDALNDQIYMREQRVEERLLVDLKFIESDSSQDTLATSILSKLDEYQLAEGSIVDASNGYYYNLLDKDYIPYLNITDAPYWSSLYTDNQTMYGQCYLASGDLAIDFIRGMYCVFFNKTLVEQAGLGNMYDVVNSGKWTHEYLLNAVKGTYVDVTGDGKTEDDVYGLLFDDARLIDSFWSAFDLTCISRDSDNNPYLDINVDKMNSVCDAIRALERDYRDIYCWETMKYQTAGVFCEDLSIEKFANDEAMFMLTNLYMTDREVIRNMKSEYGIIPLMKWDESQPDYYSFNNVFPSYAIPSTNVKPDVASAVLEALASDSYRYVSPVYYNKILKGRYLQDLESSAMIDLMVKNVKLDFGWIYDWAIAKIAQESLRYFIRENDSSFSSYWRGNKKRYQKAFDTLIAKYANMAAEGGY